MGTSRTPRKAAAPGAEAPTTSTSQDPTAAEPTASQAPDCEDALSAAVNEKFPGFGPVALDRCAAGWAYLGSASAAGDTEMVWRVVDDRWEWVTSMPTTYCPADIAAMGAPRWVVRLFDYREYAC